MIFILYAALVACVIFFAARLGHYVDLLDQKTSLASAFIGGVLLAAVTSLPELITSITSVTLVGKPELVIGNILGSNLFNVTVLGMIFLLYHKNIHTVRFTKSHITTTVCMLSSFLLLLISLMTGSSLFFHGFSGLSLLIFALYIWSIRTMSTDEDTADAGEDNHPLTLRQVVLRFTGYSILLILTSVGITYASDYIGETLGMGTTLAGALLLGIATSLPELTSSFVLGRVGNFNALTGNIVGSCVFNFAILFVADLASWRTDLYQYDAQGRLLIVFGILASIEILLLLRLLSGNKTAALPKSRILLTSVLSSALVLNYVLFVALSA